MWGVEGRRSRHQNQLVVVKISVSECVAKTVTLGFVIVIKATSRKLSWISMNTGAIPDMGIRIKTNMTIVSFFSLSSTANCPCECDGKP